MSPLLSKDKGERPLLMRSCWAASLLASKESATEFRFPGRKIRSRTWACTPHHGHLSTFTRGRKYKGYRNHDTSIQHRLVVSCKGHSCSDWTVGQREEIKQPAWFCSTFNIAFTWTLQAEQLGLITNDVTIEFGMDTIRFYSIRILVNPEIVLVVRSRHSLWVARTQSLEPSVAAYQALSQQKYSQTLSWDAVTLKNLLDLIELLPVYKEQAPKSSWPFLLSHEVLLCLIAA